MSNNMSRDRRVFALRQGGVLTRMLGKGEQTMLRLLPRSFVLGLVALALPLAAFATATVQSVSGDVKAGASAVTQNMKLPSGTTVTTGANSQVVMRFADGQQVVLNQ